MISVNPGITVIQNPESFVLELINANLIMARVVTDFYILLEYRK